MKESTRRSFLKASALGVCGAAGVAKALPAEERPAKAIPVDGKPTYRLVREIPVEEGYDLVVAGGGPAGAAAGANLPQGKTGRAMTRE